jgi:hypothetical protein
VRLGAPPPAGTVLGPNVSIVPGPGVTFTIANPAQTVSMQNAWETVLDQLSQSRMWGATIVGTAGAGNKAIAELNNPAASGKTLWVYALDFFVPAAMAINLLLDGTTLTPVGTGFNLTVAGAGGVAKVGGGNQLAPTGSLIYTAPTLAINTDYAIPLQWLLAIPQGHNMQLQGQTVNQAFTCNVRWSEL